MKWVPYITYEEWMMRKLCAKKLMQLWNNDQKQTRQRLSQQCLDRFKHNPTVHMYRLVIMDLRVYSCSKTAVEESGGNSGCSEPKKKRNSIASLENVLLLLFWMSKGFFKLSILKKSETLTSQYFIQLLDQYDEKILEKSPGLSKKQLSSIKIMLE